MVSKKAENAKQKDMKGLKHRKNKQKRRKCEPNGPKDEK